MVKDLRTGTRRRTRRPCSTATSTRSCRPSSSARPQAGLLGRSRTWCRSRVIAYRPARVGRSPHLHPDLVQRHRGLRPTLESALVLRRRGATPTIAGPLPRHRSGTLLGGNGRRSRPRAAVVGFGSATLRDGTWFLGMLFVLPEFQARGVGRQLLERVMPPQAEREAVALGTATDSVQPISNALYSQYGMVPRLPVFNFVGRPERPDALPGLPAGVGITETDWTAEASEARELSAVAAVDSATLGYAHPQDHGFLKAEGRRRFVARSERGDTLGYGYIAPSGRFGPIAAHGSRRCSPRSRPPLDGRPRRPAPMRRGSRARPTICSSCCSRRFPVRIVPDTPALEPALRRLQPLRAHQPRAALIRASISVSGLRPFEARW